MVRNDDVFTVAKTAIWVKRPPLRLANERSRILAVPLLACTHSYEYCPLNDACWALFHYNVLIV